MRFLTLLLFLTAPVWAGDGVEDFSFEPRLANQEEGARFQVLGKAPGYPDGTALHVTLMVEGRSKAPIRAAFVKVEVQRGLFSAEVSWPAQRLAPMSYKTKVVLYLNEQAPLVRKTLVQEFGWANDHCEPLGSVDTDFGTPEERGGFALESLLSLRKLVASYQELRGRLQDAFAPQLPQPPKLDALREELAKLELDLVAYKDAFVLRLEGELVQRVDSANAGVFRSVDEADDKSLKRLQSYEQEFRMIMAEIDSRKPLLPPQAHDKPEEEEPGDGKREEKPR